MVIRDAGDLRIFNILDWVCATSVFGQGRIVIINDSSLRAENNVFKDGAELDSVVDIRLLVCG